MLEKFAALGRFGLFGFRMLGAIRLSAPQFRDTVRQIYVIGARSLPIIAVGGAFVGLVMTLQGYRTLVTTLTKRMAEDLTEYLDGMGVRVRYMHADIETIERMEIIRDLRLGDFDVLVGINLLREGLDLPEVGLVAILDADKEGFLRSSTSLVQTIGRAARNVEGKVILYADVITPSMKFAMDETERRRTIQKAFNEAHGITPQSIKKAIRAPLLITKKVAEIGDDMSEEEKAARVKVLTEEMRAAARELEFEHAAKLRDEIRKLSGEEALERASKAKPGTIGAKKRNKGRSRK